MGLADGRSVLKKMLNRVQVRQQLFFDRNAERLCGPGFLYWVYFKRHLRAVTEFGRGVALDVGCGNQPYRATFPLVRCYIGLDRPSWVMNSNGHTNSIRPGVGGDALDLPVKSSGVDTVLCFQVLEHLTDPARFFREASRVLRPAGYLVLTAHGLYGIHGAPHDYFRFTEFGLRHLAQECGLKVERLWRNGSFWAFCGLMLNLYMCKRLFEQWQAYPLRVAMAGLKILAHPLLVAFVTIVNVVCYTLDQVCDDPTITSNYTLVAVKDSLDQLRA